MNNNKILFFFGVFFAVNNFNSPVCFITNNKVKYPKTIFLGLNNFINWLVSAKNNYPLRKYRGGLFYDNNY